MPRKKRACQVAEVLYRAARCLEAATRHMPRSCLLTAHSLAAGVRGLFERIDEMRADASVVFANLALLRVVVVQRAQRLGLHPNPFRLVEAVVCDVTTQLHGDCNLLQVMQKQLPHVQAPQQAH